MVNSALLHELEGVVEQLFERHLATTREWFPHQHVPYGRGRDFDAAEYHYRKALELNPNDADRRMGLGYLLALRGKPEEALDWMEEGMRLNPFQPILYSARMGIALYSLKRYADAAQALKRVPAMGYWSRTRLAACYGQLGRTAEAEAQKTAILLEKPDFTIAEFFRRDVLLERSEDRELLREGLIKAGLPA